MTRILAVIATVVLGVVVVTATAAEACISCEYVPEVVNTPVPSQEKTYRKKKPQKAVERHRTRSQRKQKVQGSKVAKTAPAKIAPAKSEDAKENTATAAAASKSGSGEEAQPPVEQVKADEGVGCRKYSPAAGTTIAVPCE